MRDYSLFLASVVTVNTDTKYTTVPILNANPVKRYINIAYTVNIIPNGGRNPVNNVPVLNTNSLTYNMPLVGDVIICGYIEATYPVCLGVLYSPGGRKRVNKVLAEVSKDTISLTKSLSTEFLPSAAKDTTNTDKEMTSYKPYDVVYQHQTGAYIRLRNAAQWTTNSLGQKIPPSTDIAEIDIYHPTGAKIQIDNGGNIIATPASGKEVKLGSSSASSEAIPLGTSLKVWLDSHTHPTGVGPSGAPMIASPSPSSTVKTI